MKPGTYYARNRSRILARAKRWYRALTIERKKKLSAYAESWQQKNTARYRKKKRHRNKALAKKLRDELHFGYVRTVLSLKTTQCPSQISRRDILKKRRELKSKRQLIRLWRTRTQFKLLEGAAQLARALSDSSKH